MAELSNAQLAKRISELIDRWNLREDEMLDWLSGTVDGGPSGDGKYPITDGQDETHHVLSPEALVDTVDGPAGEAKDARDKAQEWASNPEDQEVESGLYSALHYLEKTLAAKTTTDGFKQDAETARDSALSHKDDAEFARDQAESAQSSAETAQTGAEDAEATTLGHRDDAQTFRDESNTARDDAIDAKNDADLHRQAASDSAADASDSEAKAMLWAEEDVNVEVEPGKYSAKHHAETVDPEYLKDRANHTGTQPLSTISDSGSAAAEDVSAFDAAGSADAAESAAKSYTDDHAAQEGGVHGIPEGERAIHSQELLAAVTEAADIDEAVSFVGKGAIVESGTNSSGSYVRWENGEQVCWGNFPLTDAKVEVATKRITLDATSAASFVGTPTRVGTDGLRYFAGALNSFQGRTLIASRSPFTANSGVVYIFASPEAPDNFTDDGVDTADNPGDNSIGYIEWGFWK